MDEKKIIYIKSYPNDLIYYSEKEKKNNNKKTYFDKFISYIKTLLNWN
jgi:hypothetical protein